MQSKILKGIEFVESFSQKSIHLKNYAADFLFFFVHIAETTDDPKLRKFALSKGNKVAQRWRKMQRVPRDATNLVHTVIAEQAAHDLGCIDIKFRKRLHRKLSIELVLEMLEFDPKVEPPPNDLNDECNNCRGLNERGRFFCKSCRKKLTKLSKYDVWLNSLVVTHHLKTHNLAGGKLFKHVLKWIDSMRPYPTDRISLQQDAWEAAYAITHVIYTLTDYSLRQVEKVGLEAEFSYLENACQEAINCHDLDLLGECVDALRSFVGDAESDLFSRTNEYMLSSQNEDGSWGNLNDPAHRRMHTTWTVIDAIRSYSWHGSPASLDSLLSPA